MPTADSYDASASLRASAPKTTVNSNTVASKAAQNKQAVNAALRADDTVAAANVATGYSAAVKTLTDLQNAASSIPASASPSIAAAIKTAEANVATAKAAMQPVVQKAQAIIDQSAAILGTTSSGYADFKVEPVPPAINLGGNGGGGNGGTGTGSPSSNTGNASTTIKLATDNLLAFTPEIIDAESTANMLFQSIGGVEILEYSRSDMVYDIDNQALAYQPLSDLSMLQNKYSPKSLSGLQDAIGDSLNAYPIDISKYVPLVPTRSFYVYMEDTISSPNLDNLIIEVINITDKTQETVQVEVMNSSEIYSY